MTETESFLDDDAVVACADIVNRSGATDFEIGYRRDGVPSSEAGWYAHATYSGGGFLRVDELSGPEEAADALARRVLRGGRCTACQRTVTLSGTGTTGIASASKRCRWSRTGPKWVRGCEVAQWKTPSTSCPSCRATLDGASGTNTVDRPHAGAVTICIYCASTLVYTEQLGLRKPNESEARELDADDDVKRAREFVLSRLSNPTPPAGRDQ